MELASWVLAHKYISLFIGMIVGGDVVLITAVFLIFRGELALVPALAVATAGTLVSDMIWYSLGRALPENALVKKIMSRGGERLSQMSDFFKKHSLKTIFYSKFIYGTRVVVQILSGGNKLPLAPYLAVDFAGTVGYMALILLLGLVVHESIESLEDIVHGTQIAFVIFLIVIILIRTWIKRMAKNWFQ